MEYLPQHVIAALVFAVCVSVAVTTSSLAVTVIALAVAVAMPVAIERNVRQQKRARGGERAVMANPDQDAKDTT